MIVAGIDPGSASGAVAFVDKAGALINCYDLPLEETRLKSGKKRSRVDPIALYEIIMTTCPDIIVVEDVSGYGMGVQSSFNFGTSLGTIVTCSLLSGAELVMVAPSVWMKALGLKAADDLRPIAGAMAPDHQHLFKFKKRMHRCDALLLAEWGRLQSLSGNTVAPRS